MAVSTPAEPLQLYLTKYLIMAVTQQTLWLTVSLSFSVYATLIIQSGGHTYTRHEICVPTYVPVTLKLI